MPDVVHCQARVAFIEQQSRNVYVEDLKLMIIQISRLRQNPRYLQGQIQYSQMLISAIDKTLINVRELHGDLVLLLVAQCIVINELLIKLGCFISKGFN